jgi:hypothetical protein
MLRDGRLVLMLKSGMVTVMLTIVVFDVVPLVPFTLAV